MDLALLVYSISLLAGIKIFFATLLGCCILFIIGNLIHWAESYGDKHTPGFISRSWKTFWVAVISFWILIFIPSEKTAYTMIGAYAAQRVAENEKVQQMSGKVLTIIEQKLDGYITEGLENADKAVKDKVSK